MKKPSIVITSILKPVDDTRMFEKMGQTLAAKADWDVHIIGYNSVNPVQFPSIHFHPLGNFNRISFKRLLSPFEVFKKWKTIKPTTIIIGTHELLITAFVFKILFGAKVIYDLRENYFLNILATRAFPIGVRQLVACEVRIREWITAPFVHHYLLAEKTYEKELPFIGKKFSILENKCKLPLNFKRKVSSDEIKLLFSGTLDESTGIFEAIELSKKLNELNPIVTLTIIGYCARPSLQEKIKKALEGKSYINLIGLTNLVPHEQIMEEISKASAGIIFYPKSKHTQNCIPTKLFEYLACSLPIIFDESAEWKNLVLKNSGGIAINFKSLNCKLILESLDEKKFYPKVMEEMTWRSEEENFLEIVRVK